MGTQIDLRDEIQIMEKLAKNKQRPISTEMGEKLAKELKAVKYVECSALTQVSSISFVHCSRFRRVSKTCSTRRSWRRWSRRLRRRSENARSCEQQQGQEMVPFLFDMHTHKEYARSTLYIFPSPLSLPTLRY